MVIVNFSHPLTPEQLQTLAALTQADALRVVSVPTHFTNDASYAEQAARLLDSAPLDSKTWQAEPLLLVLPGHSVIAAALLAAIHGRCGYFPSVVRLRPKEGGALPTFEVSEIVGLQLLRDDARQKR